MINFWLWEKYKLKKVNTLSTVYKGTIKSFLGSFAENLTENYPHKVRSFASVLNQEVRVFFMLNPCAWIKLTTMTSIDQNICTLAKNQRWEGGLHCMAAFVLQHGTWGSLVQNQSGHLLALLNNRNETMQWSVLESRIIRLGWEDTVSIMCTKITLLPSGQ